VPHDSQVLLAVARKAPSKKGFVLISFLCNSPATSMPLESAMQELNHDAKTIRFRAAEQALLSAINSGVTPDAVLDEFFAAGNDYRNARYPSGSISNSLEPTAGCANPS
jgi:hypothetical protein